MKLYNTLKDKFTNILKEHNLLDEEILIKTKILTPEEAIGNPKRKDFPLLEGKEVLMASIFKKEYIGHAFTSAPTIFKGTLKEIIELSLESIYNKALFISSLNAVIRYLYSDIKTIHCQNEEPEECASNIINFLKYNYEDINNLRIGLIGLQPAILEKLVQNFKKDNILCIDNNPKNIDKIKYEILIKEGNKKETETLIKNSDIILCTGSTIVNGTIENIIELTKIYKKDIYFYGVTISGASRLLNLKRLCFNAH